MTRLDSPQLQISIEVQKRENLHQRSATSVAGHQSPVYDY